ncbi:hypothetical protein ACWEQA_04090 [Nocardia sp. NPDC004085]
MDPKKLAELRAHYDTTSTAEYLDNAVEDRETSESPMVGITVRLPANVLDAARDEADRQGLKVTALLRSWIEAAVAQGLADDRVVPVAALRNLVAETAVAPMLSTAYAEMLQARLSLINPRVSGGDIEPIFKRMNRSYIRASDVAQRHAVLKRTLASARLRTAV